MHSLARLRRDWLLYLMILPVVIGFLIVHYLPAIGTVTIALTHHRIVDGVFGSEWVGLERVGASLTNPLFWRALRAELLRGFLGLVIGFPMPILLALGLNEVRNQRHMRVVQAITCLPHLVGVLMVTNLQRTWFAYDGVINDVLVRFSMEPIVILADPHWFTPLYIGSDIWRGMGWGAIIYLAALGGIDPDLYESASIDGANRWRRAWHITLPGIAPTVTVLLIFAVGAIVNVGIDPVLMHPLLDLDAFADLPSRPTGEYYSFAAATELLDSLVGLLLIVTANYLSRRLTEHSLW